VTSLSRQALGSPAAPVRIVHLGLGAFHRAHQAWWTGAVDPRNEWGIAAFTGRGPGAALTLARQDGLFTVIERGPESDTASIVTSVVEAIDGARVDWLAELVARPETALVTLTVTEAGYGTGPNGPLARLVTALDARRSAIGSPIAVVPCDNLSANGDVARAGVFAIAEQRGGPLAEWIADRVSFVSTSVDRITPRPTAADSDTAELLTGWADAAPVVTEPFHDWVLSGEFPAGRPEWEAAGARFVPDVGPYERRKLWLLNGAHSLLAYLGQVRGHRFVAEAIADPVCRTAVESFWAEARRTLADESHSSEELGLDAYCAALLERFENTRMRHELAQIATDGETKLRLRIVPTARAEREAGRDAAGCAAAIAAWIAVTGGNTRALITLLDPDLGDDSAFVATIASTLTELTKASP
jgi:fructuronate reductase